MEQFPGLLVCSALGVHEDKAVPVKAGPKTLEGSCIATNLVAFGVRRAVVVFAILALTLALLVKLDLFVVSGIYALVLEIL